MPRLVLQDDNGRELAQAPISAANVARLAAFLRRHRAGFKVAAGVTRVLPALLELGAALGLGSLLVGPAPAPPRKRVGRS